MINTGEYFKLKLLLLKPKIYRRLWWTSRKKVRSTFLSSHYNSMRLTKGLIFIPPRSFWLRNQCLLSIVERSFFAARERDILSHLFGVPFKEYTYSGLEVSYVTLAVIGRDVDKTTFIRSM